MTKQNILIEYRKIFPILIVLLSLIFAAIEVISGVNQAQQTVQNKFNLHYQENRDRLTQNISEKEHVLTSIEHFFRASSFVNEKEFQVFIKNFASLFEIDQICWKSIGSSTKYVINSKANHQCDHLSTDHPRRVLVQNQERKKIQFAQLVQSSTGHQKGLVGLIFDLEKAISKLNLNKHKKFYDFILISDLIDNKVSIYDLNQLKFITNLPNLPNSTANESILLNNKSIRIQYLTYNTTNLLQTEYLTITLTTGILIFVLGLLVAMQVNFLQRKNEIISRTVNEKTRDLKEVWRRFELASQASGIGLWEWNIKNDALIWDDRMYQLYGLNRENIKTNKGLWEKWKNVFTRDDWIKLKNKFDHTIENKGKLDTHAMVTIANNSQKYIRIIADSHFDSDGKPTIMLGASWDITKEKVTEKALIDATYDLHKSNEELRQFAYVASHDLQAPLRHISSFVDVLKEELDNHHTNEEVKRALAIIKKGTNQMKALIRNLLEFCQMNSKKIQIRNVNLNEVILELKQTLAIRLEAANGSIECSNLPIISGDETKLRQLFQNFLENAIKFVPKGKSPKIKVFAEELPDHWTIAIQDNGIGIPEEHREKVFSIFQKLHPSQYEGTGIGLSLCKKIMDVHDGAIDIESNVGHGTTFRLYFPKKQNNNFAA